MCARSRGPEYDKVEGLLLYPQVGSNFDAVANLQGHELRLATLDLSQPWPRIDRALLELIGL